ncbi:hypothetical protein L1D16_22050 [Vibrio sp. Isolate31]|uniref:hypothetical protein n=1 Tax=unclassified Vibrio TaxID=2614977 RepID=UPI001EFDFAB8|nr:MULTISPECIES: hypothetical protein [unclassified Vibrio]MCG9555171.1 hypothetical protein [Vibrio sp. Isolate32]MCG9603399.1 hypothetical protein [Vibrio sp. Isolate31]
MKSYTYSKGFGELFIVSIIVLCTFNVNADSLNIGTVQDKTNSAKVASQVAKFDQNRFSNGYFTYEGGRVLGNTNNRFTVKVGPHNTNISTVFGNTNLAFNPEELNCVRGLHIGLTVDSDTPISISPTCDALLQADIQRTFSHNIASLEVPLPEIPIDPAGLFRLGVKIGAVLRTGADFSAGLQVGGFEKANYPVVKWGERRPDFVYASIRPFLAGDATAKGYISLNLGIKTIEKGAKGRLNLINLGTTARAEAGVSYSQYPDWREIPDKKHRYYMRMKWDTSAKGGDGSLGLYCTVKAFFGMATILNAETTIVSWSPIWEMEHTIADKTRWI